MRTLQNTLYLTTPGAYLVRDHQTLRVKVEGKERLVVPVHHLQGVVCIGRTLVSPAVYALAAETGLILTFLSSQGRFHGCFEPAGGGNVLLRRAQFRAADDPVRCLALARPIVAAKTQNSRNLLLRSARDTEDPLDQEVLRKAAAHMAAVVGGLPAVASLDAARGVEGETARTYFSAFGAAVRHHRDVFRMEGRTRRPPRDPLNALLSFVYSVLAHDMTAALRSAGLDPAVGFLHADRPGRPSLALDLLEEFRALLADRLILSLLNRRQVVPSGFVVDPGGSVRMDDATRRTVLTALQARKREEVRHPLLDETMPAGLLPFVQARLLARTLRGEYPEYPALVLK